jgi:hypothetical protein
MSPTVHRSTHGGLGLPHLLTIQGTAACGLGLPHLLTIQGTAACGLGLPHLLRHGGLGGQWLCMIQNKICS